MFLRRMLNTVPAVAAPLRPAMRLCVASRRMAAELPRPGTAPEAPPPPKLTHERAKAIAECVVRQLRDPHMMYRTQLQMLRVGLQLKEIGLGLGSTAPHPLSASVPVLRVHLGGTLIS